MSWTPEKVTFFLFLTCFFFHVINFVLLYVCIDVVRLTPVASTVCRIKEAGDVSFFDSRKKFFATFVTICFAFDPREPKDCSLLSDMSQRYNINVDFSETQTCADAGIFVRSV